MRSWGLVLCLAATVLAGCSDGGGGSPDDDTFDDFDDVHVDGDTGIIRGIVLDAFVVPLPGATVTLTATGASTTTNDNGAFIFEKLAPGSYFMEASMPGYTTVQSSAQVEAGVKTPPIVKMQLAKLPGLEPAVVPLTQEAFISCGFKTFNIVWDAGSCDPSGHLGFRASDASVKLFDTGRTDAPAYYQSEIDWTASQLLSNGLVTIQCARDNAGCGSGVGSDRICNVRGQAPLVCRIAAATPSEEVPGGGNNFTTIRDNEGFDGKFAVGLFSHCAICYPPETPVCVAPAGVAALCPGAGFGLAIDQDVQIYVHVFYNYQPPVDWLFLESGQVPGP